MSFELFDFDTPEEAATSFQYEDDKDTFFDAREIVDLGKYDDLDGTPTPSPFVGVPAVVYLLTFGLIWHFDPETSFFQAHVVASIFGFVVESIRESIVKHLVMDELNSGGDSIVGIVFYTFPLIVFYKLYQVLLALPVNFLFKLGGVDLNFVNVDNVPMNRRKETVAVLLWILLVPSVPLISFLTLYAIITNHTLAALLVPYLIFIYFDKAPRNGSRKPTFRNLTLGKHFCNYFPIKLTRGSAPLDQSKRYVFAYHPHGKISSLWIRDVELTSL